MSQPNQVSPTPSEYTQISGATTVTIGPTVSSFEGFAVVVAGTAVTVYDSQTAAGTQFVTAAPTTSIGFQSFSPTDGAQCKSGYLTIVTTNAATVLNVFYARQIP